MRDDALRSFAQDGLRAVSPTSHGSVKRTRLRQVLLREEMMRRYMPHHELGPGGAVPDELIPFAFAGDAVEASAPRPARPGRLCA